MNPRRTASLMVLSGVLWTTMAPATEGDPAARFARDVARVADDFAARADGRTALNIAAGSGNAQVNATALAVGSGESTVRATQQTSVAGAARDALAQIAGNVLASGRGLTSVNQAAGTANAQANLVAIGFGASIGLAQVVDVAQLATVETGLAVDASAAADPAVTREAVIGGNAFQGPQGVLQINQTAGVGNASANAIVLQLPGGAP